MKTNLKEREDGKIDIIFTRESDKKTRNVGLTDKELMNLAMQILNHINTKNYGRKEN